jgi:hypothetical protein
VNPRCAPQRVHRGHLSNQRSDISWHARPPRATSALQCPEQAKAAPMPGDHSRWLYDVERRSPAVPSLRQPCPQHPINCRESEPWTARTINHGELVSECDDLQV